MQFIVIIVVSIISSTWATVDIRLPPTIITQPPEVADIIEADSSEIVLHCDAEGVPPPEFTWYYNGNALSTTPYIVISRGTLTINSPNIQNVGWYQCHASNQYGTAISTVTYLQRILQGAFRDVTSVTRKTVQERDTVTLQCNPPKSVPPAVISWGIHDEVNAIDPIHLTKRIQIDGEGNLVIANAELADSQNEQRYVCQCYNHKTQDTFGGSLHTINVEQAEIEYHPPILMYKTPSPLVALEDTDVEVQCLYSGFPTPTVSWHKESGSLPGNGRTIYEQFQTKMKIQRVQKGDEGNYECRGNDDRGNIESNIVTLTVESSPSFRAEPVNHNGTVGDELVIRCVVDATPSAYVQWYRNGDPLNVDHPPSRMLFEEDGTVLKIRRLCKDCDIRQSGRITDLMVIQCNASNEHGYAFGQGYVNVFNRTELFVIPPETRHVALEEEDISLQCQGRTDGATSLDMTWYKGSDPIFSLGNNNLVVNNSDNTLNINMVGMEMEEKAEYGDTYRCQASNGYSSDEATTDVIIVGAPAGHTSIAMFPWWWLIVIVSMVLLLLILLLCCCLCAQRSKGEDYDVDKMERKNGNVPEEEIIRNGYKEFQRRDAHAMKGSRASLASSIPLDGDTSTLLGSYDDLGRFNEDGSFLGLYTNGRPKRV